MGTLCSCPRCGSWTYERFKSYAYCANCNYNSIEGFAWGDHTPATKKIIKHSKPKRKIKYDK